jgi:hypothetical protein
MKLTYKQAWAVINVILFPLWAISRVCYVFVLPILLYQKASDYLGWGFRLWLQGRRGKDWYEE